MSPFVTLPRLPYSFDPGDGCRLLVLVIRSAGKTVSKSQPYIIHSIVFVPCFWSFISTILLLNKQKLVFNLYIIPFSVTNGVPLHKFPNPDKRSDLFAAWIAAVSGTLVETDWKKIYKNKRICDHHFDPKFKITGRRLVSSAIPTVNLNRK